MNSKKLAEARDALDRAYRAALLAETFPHSSVLPCRTQMAAVKAEIECAVALTREFNPDA